MPCLLPRSTTVCGNFIVSLTKDFDVCTVYMSRLLQDTLKGLKHPQTVSIFIMYTLNVKMITIVGAINRFIP